jgi:hypothetical protein
MHSTGRSAVAFIVVEVALLRAPPEGVAHEGVADPLLLQARCEFSPVEVRRVLRVRLRAHVGERFDAVGAQVVEQRTDRRVECPIVKM